MDRFQALDMPVSLSQRQNFMLDSSAMLTTSHSYERRGKVRVQPSAHSRSRLLSPPARLNSLFDSAHARARVVQVFNDPVHGHIYLSGMACDIIGASLSWLKLGARARRGHCLLASRPLTRSPHSPLVLRYYHTDTPQFQRLRDLKQLGLTYLVFPGASHNRFEHSLGTCHLANGVFTHLYRLQKDDLGVDRMDGEVVALAGLCHDLGHGPFSHVFDTEFLPRRLEGHYNAHMWSHEQMSADMLKFLVDENHLNVDEDIIKRVSDLITSGHTAPAAAGGASSSATATVGRHPQFLRDIVANGRNSVDVDKFDYLERDCLNCGLKNSADFGRLIMYSKVIDDEICYKASEVLNLYELFHTRASLHQRVYTHRKAKAIEYMVVDCLLHADVAWGGEISNAIRSPKSFQRLDDTILKRIEWSEDPKLRDAKTILERLRRRELYRYVNEFAVPQSRLAKWPDHGVTPADVVSCQDAKGGVQLRPEDVIVHNLKIDWTSKNKNPVDSINFFQDYDSMEKFAIPREKVSSLIPETFIERKVRVFCKRSDQESADALERAFLNFQKRDFGDSLHVHSTPVKKSRKRSLEQRLADSVAAVPTQ